jgi:hypothetical protein
LILSFSNDSFISELGTGEKTDHPLILEFTAFSLQWSLKSTSVADRGGEKVKPRARKEADDQKL